MDNWKINIDDVPERHQVWQWKDGNYERYRREVSVALGNDEKNRHPFDVELTRLPPGARPCPVHVHDLRWELFIVVSGCGVVDRNGESVAVVAGDCFMQEAGTKHRIRNGSETEELLYYVIANEPEGKDTGDRVEI